MEHLICEIEGSIATVKVNRPKVLNALNRAVLTEILQFLQTTALEKRLKALILTGEGDKAFIAGADIKEMQALNTQQMAEFCALGQNVANALETAPMLTIAAVNGYALGGGLEMALACDFIYAGENAILGLPEVTLGLIPGFGGTQRLTKAIGTRLAKELIMSARTFTAKVGKEIGVVNRVCSPETLMQHCMETAKEVIKNPFSAVMGTKNAINCGISLDLSDAYELERNICAACFDTVERRTAMASFLSKRG